ncbi:MAG: hypothetical protein M3Z25_06625 [Actinomycetota bacterium]|nr:hypothetical protein [Actinomycetota bacterium]
MIPFVFGAAAGTLGAPAGRERYEQLTRSYRRVADRPAVQRAAGRGGGHDGDSGHQRTKRHPADHEPLRDLSP